MVPITYNILEFQAQAEELGYLNIFDLYEDIISLSSDEDYIQFRLRCFVKVDLLEETGSFNEADTTSLLLGYIPSVSYDYYMYYLFTKYKKDLMGGVEYCPESMLEFDDLEGC